MGTIPETDSNLTNLEAYDAMVLFLYRFANALKQKQIASLVGDLLVMDDDGWPVDPASWDDWLEAIAEVQRSGGSRTNPGWPPIASDHYRNRRRWFRGWGGS